MRTDDEHAEARPEHDPPTIPIFFTLHDLPEWLRPTEAMATVSEAMAVIPPDLPALPPPVRGESARARQAWGSCDVAPAPAETADFEVAAATALTRLVPSPPLPKKRRGLFGLGSALPLLVGAA